MTTFKIRDRRGNHRFFVDNIFLRGGWGATLGPYAIAVYNALALHADADEQSGYPSYATIAKLTGMSRQQAIREVAKLEEYHIIQKEPRYDDDGSLSSNDYVLLSPAEWLPVDPPSDSQLLPLVTHSYYPSDSQLPKQDSSNKTQIEVGPFTQKLLSICCLDFNRLTKRQSNNLTESLDILVNKIKATEQDLDSFAQFWEQSWRNGPPSLLQIPETWGEFEQWKINPNGKDKQGLAFKAEDEIGGFYA